MNDSLNEFEDNIEEHISEIYEIKYNELENSKSEDESGLFYENPNILYFLLKKELYEILSEFLVNIISLQNYSSESEKNEEIFFNIFKINYIHYLKEYNEKVYQKFIEYSLHYMHHENNNYDLFNNFSEINLNIISNNSYNDEYSHHFLHQENNNKDLFNNSSQIHLNIISKNSISDYNDKIINERTHFIQSYDTFIDNDEEIKSLNLLLENKEENENRNNNNNDLSFKSSLLNSSIFSSLNPTRQIANSHSIKNVLNKDIIEEKVKKIARYLIDIKEDEYDDNLSIIHEDIDDDSYSEE